MDLGTLVGSALDSILRRSLDDVVLPGVATLLELVSSSEQITSLPFFTSLHRGTLVVGIALLTAITMWSLCKAFFAFTGIEADEPLQVGLQLGAALFFTWYSKDILLFTVDLNGAFINAIHRNAFAAGEVTGLDAQSFLGGLTNLFTGGLVSFTIFSIQTIAMIYVLVKVIMLLLRIFRRTVLMAFLIIGSPLAFAAGISRNTRPFQVGFLRVFVGNLVVQLVQSICLMAITYYTLDTFLPLPKLLGLYGIIYVSDRLEDIVRDMSFGLGVGREGGGGAMAAIHMFNTVKHALTRALPTPT